MKLLEARMPAADKDRHGSDDDEIIYDKDEAYSTYLQGSGVVVEPYRAPDPCVKLDDPYLDPAHINQYGITSLLYYI